MIITVIVVRPTLSTREQDLMMVAAKRRHMEKRCQRNIRSALIEPTKYYRRVVTLKLCFLTLLIEKTTSIAISRPLTIIKRQ